MDGTLFWTEIVLYPAEFDSQLRIAASVRDITERRKLQSQLSNRRKWSLLDGWREAFAHDFNNMLSVILGYSQVALNRIDPSEPIHGTSKKS